MMARQLKSRKNNERCWHESNYMVLVVFAFYPKKRCLFKTSYKAKHKGLEIFIVSASFRSPRPVKFPGKHNTVFIIRPQMVTNKTECYLRQCCACFVKMTLSDGGLAKCKSRDSGLPGDKLTS